MMKLQLILKTLFVFTICSGMSHATEYAVKVRTGRSFGAGTDANVYIKLVGINGVTAEHHFSGSGSTFEKGSLDTFTFNDNIQIGDLTAIKIRRDENGWFPRWQLQKIAVQNKTSGKWLMFDYRSWTSPNKWITIPVTCDADYKKNTNTGACEGPLCGTKMSLLSSRILGVSRIHPASWPWLGIVEFNDGSRVCSGALISSRWVMTTAWCVYGKKATQLRVRFGADNANTRLSTEQTVNVASSYIHPDYHKYTLMSHDLALLKLSRQVTIGNTVKPACRPLDEIPLPINDPVKKCWFQIWGRQTGNLQQVPIPLKTLSSCVQNGRPLPKVHESMICGKLARNATGPCTSDAGGPLTCEAQGRWYLEGLISTGTDCYIDESKNRLFSNIRYLKGWAMSTMNSNPGI